MIPKNNMKFKKLKKHRILTQHLKKFNMIAENFITDKFIVPFKG